MINGHPFKINYVLLVLCLLGIGLVAWWAWAAGPVENRPSFIAAPKLHLQKDVSQNSLAPASASSAIGSSAGSAGTGQTVTSPPAQTGNVSSGPITPPINTQPSYPTCPELIGAQSDALYYPCGCHGGGYIATTPCCQYSAGNVCGCGGASKADVMCPL